MRIKDFQGTRKTKFSGELRNSNGISGFQETQKKFPRMQEIQGISKYAKNQRFLRIYKKFKR